MVEFVILTVLAPEAYPPIKPDCRVLVPDFRVTLSIVIVMGISGYAAPAVQSP